MPPEEPSLPCARRPRILRYETIDSTQAEARRVLIASPADTMPFAVVAQEQTAGVGRRARAWSSPRGGLWVTGAWPLPDRSDAVLGLRIGLAVLDAVSSILRDQPADLPRLKWPNDIMIGGRKAAGILTEIVPAPVGKRAALIGVGINTNIQRGELPAPIRDSAAILREIAGEDVDLERLLEELLGQLSRSILSQTPAETIIARADGRLHRRGEQVALLRGDGTIAQGTLAAIDVDGEPMLIGDGGTRIPGPFTGFADAVSLGSRPSV